MEEPNGQAETQRPDNEALLRSIDELPLAVTFELGRTQLTFSELRGIAPGSIIELKEQNGGTVGIRVNGAMAGSGTIVKIDNRLAVRVDSLVPAHTESAGEKRDD